MAEDEGGRTVGARFTGLRSELFGTLFRGYLLMIPTIGLYRFWLVTAKRRFYWSHTEIDGDGLEYTGRALQLLIGFLVALVVFIPIYGLFFYLSTQNSSTVLIGYGAIGVLMWFLMGYATYRARDFRLSRTLWRGIRFDQKGSAWNYAFRRFGWSILMVVTLGLIYPVMAANLWRYRYANTWFGDRQFGFGGSWKQVAGPFYLVYFLVAVPLVLAAIFAALNGGYYLKNGTFVPSAPLAIGVALIGLGLWLGVYFYQSREISRMFSSVTVGEAKVTVKVRARALLGQFLLFGIVFVVVFLGITLGLFSAIGALAYAAEKASSGADASWRLGVYSAAVPVLGYLIGAASYAIISEMFLGFGYWRLIARNATIVNVDSLRSVRAGAEDTSLAGEGLADALNVGAY